MSAPVLAGLGPVDQDPDEVRRSACELLSPSVRCTVRQIEPREPPSGVSIGWLVDLLLAVLVAGVVAVIVWLVYRAIRSRRPAKEKVTKDDDDLEIVGDVVVDRSREPVDWRSEADRHAAAGRLRDAVRCRYRALVGDLARRGLLDEIPGRTSGEERAQLAVNAPQASDSFDPAALLFDDVWFGDAAVAADDLDRFLQWERTTLDATARTRRPLVGSDT